MRIKSTGEIMKLVESQKSKIYITAEEALERQEILPPKTGIRISLEKPYAIEIEEGVILELPAGVSAVPGFVGNALVMELRLATFVDIDLAPEPIKRKSLYPGPTSKKGWSGRFAAGGEGDSTAFPAV
jgi:hypothetical protein